MKLSSGHIRYSEPKYKASISANTLLGQQNDIKIGDVQPKPRGARLKVPHKTYTKRELTQRYTEKRKQLLQEIYLRIARSENMAAQVAHLTLGLMVGFSRESVCKNVSLFIARGDLEAWVPNRLRFDKSEALIYRVPSASPIYYHFRKTIASIGGMASVSRNVFTRLMLYHVSENISYFTSSYSQEIAYEETNARAQGDSRWRKVGLRSATLRNYLPPVTVYEKNHKKESSMPFRQINVLLQSDSEAAELAAPSSELQRVTQLATFNELRTQAILAKSGIDLSAFAIPGMIEKESPPIAPPPPLKIKSIELEALMLEWMASRAKDNKAIAELKDCCPIDRWSPRTLELKAKIDEIKARMAL